MSQYSGDIVVLCRLMQLLNQFGTLALRTLLTRKLFVKYIQSRRATFTYFTDKTVVVTEHGSSGKARYSTTYRVPNTLPDIDKCVRNSKDGEDLLNIIEKSFLTETVNNNMTRLSALKTKKVINQIQWETLFSNNTVNIHDLDISLLSLLLFNIFNCKPTVDMKSLPLIGNTMDGDDVLRLRIYRNKIAHLTSLVIPPTEFKNMWTDISCAVIRLLGSVYQNGIDRLKVMSFDEATVIRYRQLRKEWSETVTDIYQSLSDITEELRSIKKRPRHRKGVAIQLTNSDDLQKALRVLRKKGITAKVISLDEDETDSDSSESLLETVSRSTGCLGWSEDLDGENTIRASQSSTYLGPETRRTKEMAKPFYEMFPGNKPDNDTQSVPQRWSSMPDTITEFTGQNLASESTSSLDSLLEDVKEKDETPQQKDSRVESTHTSSVEIQHPTSVPEMEPKTKKKTFWHSFKRLF